MRNDALPALVGAAVISGVLCLMVGGAAAYFLLSPAPAPAPGPARAPAVLGPVASNDSAARNEPVIDRPDPKLAEDLRVARERADKLDSERQAAIDARTALEVENARLKTRVAELEKAATQPPVPQPDKPAGGSGAPVTFGKYGELDELKNADWKELGDALQNMVPHMEPIAQALREGKQPDPDTMKKIGAHNMKLVKLAVALQGKVPTHTSNVNGEYTHPVSIVNLVASQLAAAGNPFTDAQKKRLSELGDDYEKRWKSANDAYTTETLLLKKILDEAELKQWFTDQMWLVTTPEQKALVVNPNVEGYLGLDLYSPALMFQGIARPMQVPNRDTLKNQMKDWIAKNFGVLRENLDGAEYAFDDWLTSLNLTPKGAAETNFMHFREIIAAGKAQVQLMTTLLATVMSDAELAKKVREDAVLIVPQVIEQ